MTDPKTRDGCDRPELWSPHDPGLVEELLKAAGPGPDIPRDGADAVKATVRPVWRQEVAARRRIRRRIWIGGGAAAAALLLLGVILPVLRPSGAPSADPAFAIAKVRGSVKIVSRDGVVNPVDVRQTGRAVAFGSTIRSDGDGMIALTFDDGRSLRIGRESLVRLSGPRSIELARGAVYVDSGNEPQDPIEVRTALGVARDIGTRFEVRYGDLQLTIRVRDGLVSLSRDGADIEVARGTALSVSSTGAVSTVEVAPHDETWAWVQEIAPGFRIEGRTVSSFLGWVSDETGMRVEFAGEDVGWFAADTVLHGSIEGLSPTEALITVLPGSRLRVTELPGVLMIDFAE